MTTAPEQAGPNYDGVSPELIAAITERVKREGWSSLSLNFKALSLCSSELTLSCSDGAYQANRQC